MNRTSRVITAILLLLLVLYVGSYLALVAPDGIALKGGEARVVHYRVGDPGTFAAIYWPIEQVDRMLRPRDWDDSL